jgi:hypothetical protein
MQTPAVHTPLSQSFPPVHTESGGHRAQIVPPQSTSDSSWFTTPSVQLAPWHTLPTQFLLSQSSATLQP